MEAIDYLVKKLDLACAIVMTVWLSDVDLFLSISLKEGY